MRILYDGISLEFRPMQILTYSEYGCAFGRQYQAAAPPQLGSVWDENQQTFSTYFINAFFH